MEKNYIDGSTFADMIVSGAANLSSNKTTVNDLNVFPIPDGDTGDNMFMTIESGARMLRDSDSDSLSEASSVASRGMLLGARGNSGVILSRIFSGISKGLEDKPSADVRVLHLAMERGIQESYSAVPVPVEGTILTVYRDAVKFAGDRIDENSTLDSYFRDFNTELRRSLEHTPEQLDVLKEAGVVDSGGAGLVYIFDGMLAALEGTGKQLAETATASSAPRIDLSLFTEDSELKFGYCTEFLLRLQHKKTDIDSFDIDEFIRGLSELGDSVVAFRDGSIVKVHVHSLTPGKVLDYGQRFGEFLTLKVENMTLQHSSKEHGEHNRDADAKKSIDTQTMTETPSADADSAASEKTATESAPVPTAPHKHYATVAVAAGKGLVSAFYELGADKVISGGQSMNPSTEDFIDAFDGLSADVILVFPNNSNIILTANQAASIYDKAQIVIIPTKTVGEGCVAISMVDPDESDSEALKTALCEAISAVDTGFVSRAGRDASFKGVDVTEGDYIGFSRDTIYSSEPTRREALLKLAECLDTSSHDLAMLFSGADTDRAEAEELTAELSKKFPSTEFAHIRGDQPTHDYILVLE